MPSHAFRWMRRNGLGSLAIAAAVFSAAQVHAATTLSFSGNYDDNDASTNETDVPINDGGPYFFETQLEYTEFQVPLGQVWTVSNLFVYDEIAFSAGPATATWEIRTGMSPGNGGTLLYSGDTTATATETNAAGGNYVDTEYDLSVPVGTGVVLVPGTYWLALAPDSEGYYTDQSYLETTSGSGAIGAQPGTPVAYVNNNLAAGDGGEDFAVADYPNYSVGVQGIAIGVPEPAGWPIFAGGIVAAAFLTRRRGQRVARSG